VLMELHYEARITEIEQRISALKPFVEQVEKGPASTVHK
jgi:hypothetical protein